MLLSLLLVATTVAVVFVIDPTMGEMARLRHSGGSDSSDTEVVTVAVAVAVPVEQ